MRTISWSFARWYADSPPVASSETAWDDSSSLVSGADGAAGIMKMASVSSFAERGDGLSYSVYDLTRRMPNIFKRPYIGSTHLLEWFESNIKQVGSL
jgi:hypothetical protein